jgi:hypothetical protein
MEFDIQPIKEGDYENFLSDWWIEWKWKPPLKDFLPDNGTGGIVVYDNGIPICAGFLYVTNSKVSWVDWIVSNPKYRKKPHRKQAMILLIDTLTNISKNLGNKYVYALIKHSSLIETYQLLGYVKGESYTHEMIKVF